MININVVLGALGLIVLVLLFGWVGQMDYEDEEMYQKHHCEMRYTYELDKLAGYPPEQRRGWPEFDVDRDAGCSW
jgi:hypothetical protein